MHSQRKGKHLMTYGRVTLHQSHWRRDKMGSPSITSLPFANWQCMLSLSMLIIRQGWNQKGLNEAEKPKENTNKEEESLTMGPEGK